MNITNYHSSSSPKPIPPARASSSSAFSSFLVSATLVSSAFVVVSAATGAALPEPVPTFDSKFPRFCPVSALANRVGQYFSTLFPDAVIIFWILSDYIIFTVISTPSSWRIKAEYTQQSSSCSDLARSARATLAIYNSYHNSAYFFYYYHFNKNFQLLYLSANLFF